MLRLTHKKLLNTNIDKVWSTISKASNLELFHPLVDKNPVIKWEDTNRSDEIHYLNGHIYQREFVNWMPQKGYNLYINRVGYPKSYVKWRIQEIDRFKTLIDITIYPYLQSFLPFFIYVKPELKKYLKQVLGGLDWYLKNNKRIPKENHRWFS